MSKTVETDQLLWPIIYKGIEESTGDAIFFNELTGETTQVPRIPDCWEGDVLVLYDMADERKGIPAKKHYFPPGSRLKLPKQAQFIRWAEEYDGVLFGGAAGGGKSRMLLMLHVYFHLSWCSQGIYNVKTGMFCETNPDLYDRQISMIEEWIPSWMGRYYHHRQIFVFKKKFGGGRILFRSLEDTGRFRSIEFALVTVDELTRNDEVVVDNLKSRLRSTKVRRRIFAASTNPGEVGHEWVKRRFVDEETRDRPGYSERYRRHTRGHAFIQCLPTENPLLDPEYYINLEKLAPHIRDAQLYGRWDVFEGQYFKMLNPAVHRIARFNIPDEVPKFRAIDVGGHHPFVCQWFALFPPSVENPRGRLILYREYSALGQFSSEHKKQIALMSKKDKNILMTVMSPDAWSVKGSTAGDKTIAERFSMTDRWGPNMNPIKANNDRIAGWRAMADALSYESTLTTNENGETTREITLPPYLQIFIDCRLTWESWTHMIHDRNNPEDVQKTKKSSYAPGRGDDESDTSRYGVMAVDEAGQLINTDEYEDGNNKDEWWRDQYEEDEYASVSDYARF
jgi:hypothetical protein